jgi:hypothetical protein
VGLIDLVPTPCGMEKIRTLINFWPNLRFIKKNHRSKIIQNIVILWLLKFLQLASLPYNTNLWQGCEVWIFGKYRMKQLLTFSWCFKDEVHSSYWRLIATTSRSEVQKIKNARTRTFSFCAKENNSLCSPHKPNIQQQIQNPKWIVTKFLRLRGFHIVFKIILQI